ncbi:hypothetical protein EX895_001569 [Sporisorium graminicola]|uniref:Uncharacterized protein n=1 Tax=Sporisorium graminicola TaxID=280036 RepID=A0A4U7KZW8_9BASI|nr:hypothetical protein EX895_001569 [Sporisorium graminicola]TKY89038.1 hypothetical protein EX895_001569 [Sporisorium graminicola]
MAPVSITPPDKSFRVHAWGLLAGKVVLCMAALADGHYVAVKLGAFFAFDMPAIALFFIIAHRNISFERGVALRYTLPTEEFRSMIRFRPILDADGVKSHLTGLFGNLPGLAAALMAFGPYHPALAAAIWVLIVFTALITLYTSLNMALALKAGHRAARLAKTEDPPLSTRCYPCHWTCLGSSSVRKEEVWARKAAPGAEKDQGAVYELAVRYRKDHFRYRADRALVPIRKPLRIVM